MQDISYDKSKVDVVFNFTERALEQNNHLDIICERLKVLEKMHQESPNIEGKMNAIRKGAATSIPDAYDEEKQRTDKVKSDILSAVDDLKTIM